MSSDLIKIIASDNGCADPSVTGIAVDGRPNGPLCASTGRERVRDRRIGRARHRLERKVIQAGRDERTRLRFSRISIARCADLVRSSASAWGPLSQSGHVYLRMHGPDHHHLYAGSYPDADLRWWAGRIREWSLADRDVFAYFNNDGNANAVRNARTLQALLGPDGASHPATSRASCHSLHGRST